MGAAMEKCAGCPPGGCVCPPDDPQERHPDPDYPDSSWRPPPNDDEAPVIFSGKSGPNGIFSSDYPASIYIENKKWPTVEHYVQAHKFKGNKELIEEFRLMATPEEAKSRGRRGDVPVRSDWYQVRDKYMKGGTQAKFFQHYDLRAQLLSTKDREIIFQEPDEEHWGTGPGGLGHNMLGKILMELRSEIRKPMSRTSAHH